jgi:hypothetical protein
MIGNLEANPILLARQPTPTKIMAQFVDVTVNMKQLAEKRMPAIVHFTDFVFGGTVLRTSIIKRGTIRDLTTSCYSRATKWAIALVMWHAGNDWARCYVITTDRLRDLPINRSRHPKRRSMRCVQAKLPS